MAQITFDQVVQAALPIVGTCLVGSIVWGVKAVIKRIDNLEQAVAVYAEKLVTLTINGNVIQKEIQEIKHGLESKASKEVVERIDERQEDIAKRLHHVTNEVTKVKITQEKCRACNS